MSTPTLPENPALWPDDPYALLGVERGVGPQDLKRAYTRLIRTYKPDDFPEQFRRIREAYEAILHQAEVAKFIAENLQGTPGGATASADPASAGLDAQLHALWEQAVAGGDAAAYAALEEISGRHPGRMDVYLRLYWLLALYPELDAGRSAFDWLARAARQAGWGMPLMEMVRREAYADPALAAGPAFGELLADFGRPQVLVALADWRWDAACRLGKWTMVRDDVERLRGRVRAEGDEAWARFLQVAVNHLAWAEDEALLATAAGYFEEIKGLEHLHGRMGQELDQVEFLRGLSGAWQELRREPKAPRAVVEIVPLCWLRPAGEVRGALMDLVGAVARDPHGWLEGLGVVAAKAPPVLNFVAGTVARLQENAPHAEDPRPGELLGRTLGEFVLSLKKAPYPTLRKTIFDFCLRESIAPETLVAFCRGHAPDRLTMPAGPLSGMIEGDWALRFVCLASRVLAAWG